jgi:hypothetical protein
MYGDILRGSYGIATQNERFGYEEGGWLTFYFVRLSRRVHPGSRLFFNISNPAAACCVLFCLVFLLRIGCCVCAVKHIGHSVYSKNDSGD